MKRILSLLSVVVWGTLLAAPGARGQWIQLKGPYGGDIDALASNGNFLFAGTFEGLFRSSDDGKTWEALTTLSISASVYSVIANGSEIFAGSDSSVYRSSDNGMTWSQCMDSLFGILSLAMLSDQSIVAGTDGDGILLSTNDGVDWSFAGAASSEVISIASTQGHYFAATTSGFFASSDSGRTWDTVHTGFGDGSIVAAVCAYDSSLFAGTENGLVITTTDNGAHWSKVGSGDIGQVIRSMVVHLGVLYAGTAFNGLYKWDGTQWNQTSLAAASDINALAQTPSSVFAGCVGHVFRSTDMGSSWVVSDTGISSVQVLALGLTGATASEPIYYVSTAYDANFRSTDNGNTWQQLNFPVADDILLFQTVGQKLLAGTVSNGVFASTDYGISWNPSDTGLPPTPLIYDFALDNQNLYVITSGIQTTVIDSPGAIYRSIDSGNSWTWLYSNSLDRIFTLISARNGNIVACGQFNDAFRSTDNGSSWETATTTIASPTIYCLTPSGTDFLAGTANGIFRTTDTGANWAPSGLNGMIINAFADSGSLVFAGTTSGAFVSQDHGTTWRSITRGIPDSNITSLEVSGPNLLAGTYHGIWLISIGDVLSNNSVPSPHPANERSILAYPNPFIHSTTIAFITPSPGYADVRVMSALGVEVARVFSGELSAGAHSLAWSAPPGLAAGIYQCIVRINGGAEDVPIIVNQ